MAARDTDEGTSRWERALQSVETLTTSLGDNDRAALVLADDQASLAIAWTDHHSAVHEAALARTPAGRGEGLRDALKLADGLCRQRPHTTIVLISDTAGLTLPDMQCPVHVETIGEAVDNIALTTLQVRHADRLGLTEIHVEALNDTDTDQRLDIDLRVDGELVEVLHLEVAARRQTGQMTRLNLPEGVALAASIGRGHHDALADDDVLYALLPQQAQAHVLVVGEEPSRFLRDALTLHPHADVSFVTPTQAVEHTRSVDLLVLDGVLPATLPKADHVLAIDTPVDNIEGLTVPVAEPTVKQPRITRWSEQHALLRFVDLNNVQVGDARRLRVDDTVTSLIDGEHGPLLMTLPWETRNMIYMGFRPEKSDLVLRVAFVHLMANIVTWASPSKTTLQSQRHHLGQRLRDVAEGDKLVPIVGQDTALLAADKALTARGVFMVQRANQTDEDAPWIVVNLASANESRLAPADTLPGDVELGLPSITHVASIPWQRFLIIALALLALEWLLPLLRTLFQRIATRMKTPSLDGGTR